LLGLGEEKIARRRVARVDAGLCLEGPQLPQGEQGEPDVDLGGELGPEAAGGALGTALAGIDDHDPSRTGPGEMVSDAPADHPAADDDDVGDHR